MIQANPSYRFTNERSQRTSHKHGSHSVTLLALEPVAAVRHISDQTRWWRSCRASDSRAEPHQHHDDQEVSP